MGKKLNGELIRVANQRFIGLGTLWDRGPFRTILANRPIFTPDDIKGLKLRLWPARMIQKAWGSLGAQTRVVDFKEAYLALKQGVVESITISLNSIIPNKLCEVTQYCTALDQWPEIFVTTINERVWQGLTPEEQKIIVDGSEKAGKWYNEYVYSIADKNIKGIINDYNMAYIQVNRKPFVDVFRDKVIPGLIGEGLIKEEWVKNVESLRK
jgi:TRAP-type C4-dicarboxylate transport system substrate-binding protein